MTENEFTKALETIGIARYVDPRVNSLYDTIRRALEICGNPDMVWVPGELLDCLRWSREALNIFQNCAYPVAEEINKRGYNWCEAYLDSALGISREAINQIDSLIAGERK